MIHSNFDPASGLQRRCAMSAVAALLDVSAWDSLSSEASLKFSYATSATTWRRPRGSCATVLTGETQNALCDLRAQDLGSATGDGETPAEQEVVDHRGLLAS